MGIALGGALGAWLNLLLLWRFLAKRLGGLFEPAALKATVRLAAAVAVAAIAASAVRGWLDPRMPGHGFLYDLALLLAVGAAGAVPYLLIARRPPVILSEEPLSEG
jgi:peptidoglycan biosynthesis protein MviN/MurJ (putative lipid II flippase)